MFLNPSTLGLVWVVMEVSVASLCLQQCLHLKAAPLCLWHLCGLQEQICVAGFARAGHVVVAVTVLFPWDSAQGPVCFVLRNNWGWQTRLCLP